MILIYSDHCPPQKAPATNSKEERKTRHPITRRSGNKHNLTVFPSFSGTNSLFAPSWSIWEDFIRTLTATHLLSRTGRTRPLLRAQLSIFFSIQNGGGAGRGGLKPGFRGGFTVNSMSNHRQTRLFKGMDTGKAP